MIIESTVEQDYEILRYHVTQLTAQIENFDPYSETVSDKETLMDTADTVAEAFDALDRKLKDGDAFPIEWTKNR